jgi:hypothetical protein
VCVVAVIRVHRPVINPRLLILNLRNDCACYLRVRVGRVVPDARVRVDTNVSALALGCLAGELSWPLDPGLACDPCGRLAHKSPAAVSSLGGTLAARSPELGCLH